MTRDSRTSTRVLRVSCWAVVTTVSATAQPVRPPLQPLELSGPPQAWFTHPPRVFESEHFRILHDTPDSHVETLGPILEATFNVVQRFSRELVISTREPREKLQIVFFDRFDDFKAVLERVGRHGDVVGLYLPDANLSVLCRLDRMPEIEAIDRELHRLEKIPDGPNLELFRSRRDALLRRVQQTVVAHEAAHQALFNVGLLEGNAGHPSWLIEGMACLFETAFQAGPSDRRAVNDLRLADLREDDLQLDDFKTLVGDSEMTAPAGTAAARRYAQAYVLVDFLHQKHSTELAAYLRRRPIDGRDPNQRIREFESAFGPLDEAFAGAFKEHFQTLARSRPPQPESGE